MLFIIWCGPEYLIGGPSVLPRLTSEKLASPEKGWAGHFLCCWPDGVLGRCQSLHCTLIQDQQYPYPVFLVTLVLEGKTQGGWDVFRTGGGTAYGKCDKCTKQTNFSGFPNILWGLDV